MVNTRGPSSGPQPIREPHREEDRRWVGACRAGDPAALDRFFTAHVRLVEHTVARLVGPTPDLEDLVQNTFLEALRALPTFRGEARLSTWLTRIAVHVCCRHLRRGVRRMVPLEALSEYDEPTDHAPRPDVLADSRRVAARLHAVLDRIKPKKRVAFLLYVLDGYRVEEIAALTGSSATAVKSQLFFARRELQALVRGDRLLDEHVRALLAEPAR